MSGPGTRAPGPLPLMPYPTARRVFAASVPIDPHCPEQAAADLVERTGPHYAQAVAEAVVRLTGAAR